MLRQARLESKIDFERSFDPHERKRFHSTEPLPTAWLKRLRARIASNQQFINPGGLVKAHSEDKYLVVDIYPPKERPDTWTADNCLYLIRHLVALPLQFEADEENPPLRTSDA